MAADNISKRGWSSPFDDDAPAERVEPQEMMPAKVIAQTKDLPVTAETEGAGYLAEARRALDSVDDIVTKGYLERLDKMEVMPFEGKSTEESIIMFKVDLMAYEKDEYATDKFVSAFSAMTYTTDSVFLIVDGFEDHTDFYIGVKNDSEFTTHSVASTLESSLKGQFPGIRLRDLSMPEADGRPSAQHKLLRDMAEANTVSSSIGVPSLKGKDNYTNASYIQGIEKFADAMQGKRYTAIILAQNQMPSRVDVMRSAYENLYSQLAAMATQQMTYGTNESFAEGFSHSTGVTDTISDTVTDGTTHTDSINESVSKGTSKSKSKSTSKGTSKKNLWGQAGPLASPLMEAGAILTVTGVGAPVGIGLMAVGGALGLGSMFGDKTKSKNVSESESSSESENMSRGSSVSDGTSHSVSQGTSHGDTVTDTDSKTTTTGTNKTIALTLHNKKVEEILKRIDRQLERIDSAEGTGLWSTSAYFLSYDVDRATAQTAATIFRSLMLGDESGVETSAVNTWKTDEEARHAAIDGPAMPRSNVPAEKLNGALVLQALTSLTHPVFSYSDSVTPDFNVEGTSLLTSSELAMIMGLPRKSVPGLPVIDHISLGKEVVKLNGEQGGGTIDIGVIYDQGIEHPHNKVKLNAKSLTQHVFVTGSTGSGKSETVYRLIEEAVRNDATFLVIEPAKGEYKTVFGNANVFGTNPLLNRLIRINPFRFPQGIHVLEHIDRLVEIFNVCWPMYAAMPAVLKKAVIRSYENCGWELYDSVNRYAEPVFPSFVDLLNELETAINESAYSEEVKGNYIGSLVTRVESLTNGINGEIFSSEEVADTVLFDRNTIVDLSRIGAQETKALIMGILVMRLNEYRMVTATGANAGLRHLTILEEAHNILKRTSTEQSMEESNVAGKSVEMLINSIAEMRTYGEGFVIVDQSPTSVHEAAIKNTNTKVIMRLPYGEDRKIAGKSAAMQDNHIDEIAKLPTGVAVVYQNDWMQPVMAKISMMRGDRTAAPVEKDRKRSVKTQLPTAEILKLLLKGRLATKVEPDIDAIDNGVKGSSLSMADKGRLLAYVEEYKGTRKLGLWANDRFPLLSKEVARLLGVENKVTEIAKKADSFDDLNRMLSGLLKAAEDIPEYMELTIKQALLRNYAETDMKALRLYNAWIQDIKRTEKQNEHRKKQQ